MATITGTNGDDNIVGTSSDDFIDALDGNDTVDAGAGNDTVWGGGGNDTLSGGAGDDSLVGGAGVDVLIGGTGNDTYFVDHPADVVIEAAGDVFDQIYTQVSYTLPDHVERINLLGTTVLTATGNDAENSIVGNNAASVLIGKGGNDSYFINNVNTSLIENAGEGFDTALSFVTYVLPNEVERLELMGSATINGTGNSLNNTLVGLTNSAANVLAGGLGNDTYSIGAGDTVVEGVGEGIDSVETTVTYTLAANIENVQVGGTVALNITGNELGNVIDALNSTANVLSGRGGDDYYIISTSDTVVEYAGEGIDTVQSVASYTLSANVENLVLKGAGVTGIGNASDNVIVGYFGNDTLSGENGNDRLDGGAGADALIGGSGNDTFVIDNQGDFVSEATGGGQDTVESSIIYTLTANVENLLLTGAASLDGTGNASANLLTGNSAANVLSGGAGDDILRGGEGNDTLEGGEGSDQLYGEGGNDSLLGGVGNDLLDGGSGDDVLYGGAGDDTYILSNPGDVASELADNGTDTIESNFSYGLGADIENLKLTGVADLGGFGNQLANSITGNSGNNFLSGEDADDMLSGGDGFDTLSGGDGDDWLIGGEGNDTLSGEDGSDVLQGGAGDDFLFGDNLFSSSNVQGDDVLEGGEGQDYLVGYAGEDRLDGGGGADYMEGGSGNDTYVVDNYGDVLVEGAGAGGIDVVESSVDSYGLGLEFENLTLIGPNAFNGVGNQFDNVILGNDRANSLSGGNGNDQLSGGVGNDFISGGRGLDLIQGGVGDDFIWGDDGLIFSDGEDDTLYGEEGNDTLHGENGNDILMGGAGADTLWGEMGDDYLDGGIDDAFEVDQLVGGIGNDTYLVNQYLDQVFEAANEGVDTIETSLNDYWIPWFSNIENLTFVGIQGSAGTGNELGNVIIGNVGNDSLSGQMGDDVLSGGGGQDQLVGGEGDDVLMGGADVDSLMGGEGNDTYRFNIGDGVDTILDMSFPLEGNRIHFGGGIVAQDLTLSYDPIGQTLTIQVGTAGDAMRLVNFDPSFSRVIATVQFDDGSQVAMAELLGATEGDDILSGTFGNDVIDGLAGNDTINGLAGDDVLLGGQGSDTLNGGDGDDLLDGGDYIDTMIGGAGNDTYLVDQLDEITSEVVGEGVDIVQTSISGYTLAENVENLTLTGTAMTGFGNSLNNVLVGNDAVNILNAWQGNDLLDGGVGADIMAGMDGDDTYLVDDVGDLIIEGLGQGIDTVNSSVSFSLLVGGNDVENLILTGSTGLSGTGNVLDNTLVGNSGDNVLDGSFGNDTMRGGMGNDIYVVGEFGDVVVEQADGGVDTVNSSLSFYTLGANVENVTLVGFAFDATGNQLGNTLIGNDMDNRLNGGAGPDIMRGGLGNDTYVVDTAGVVVGDLVVENIGEGVDTVESYVDYTLTANVERLTLIGIAISGTGNELDNSIQGTDGNNVIDGRAGADTMAGGLGDDVYVIDNVGDVIVDVGPGIDTVRTAMTYELGVTAVENLVLTGSAAVNGAGNGIDNVIAGNDAANILDGMSGNDTLIGGGGDDRLIGGFGSDVLIGGLGNDTYVVDQDSDTITELAGEGIDTVESASGDYTMSTNVERLTMTGAGFQRAVGNVSDNIMMGTSDSNVLLGEDGNDGLFGNDGLDGLGGGAGNDLLDGGAGADMMFGGTGDDVFVVDDVGDFIVELAGEGQDVVNAAVSYVLSSDAEVEMIVLSGSDAISATGSNIDNTLIGNSGDNMIDGGYGNDIMQGGAGDDTYVISQFGDAVIEQAGEGIDTVQSAFFSYTLEANVENITLIGSAIQGGGNDLNNHLVGNTQGNLLDGGVGADTMVGGQGDDIYVVDNMGDVVTESEGEGVDTIQSSISYTLSANVESLTLTGVAAINATGSAIDNVLIGNSGANVLDGGLGNDTMRGGLGNDTYVVDNAGDVVVENLNEGIDTVQSSVTYVLGANVENLSLTGSFVINGTGNALNNVLTGNSAANVLDGGAGGDTMAGGQGDDTYLVESMFDVVTELGGEGIDTIQRSFESGNILADNVEHLTLTSSTAIMANGNTLDNVIRGNGAGNVIDGLAGADTMIGGDGNDAYLVDNANDVVIENVGEGVRDSVLSSISYSLSANIEELWLQGVAAIDATGNSLDNTLMGNVAGNVLDGSVGADAMWGGAGDDTYVVDNVNDATIENANEGIDTIQSSVTYALSANVENLILTGTSVVNGSGNALNNSLTGNSAANILSGGAGNDTYIVGAGDSVIENVSEGIDIVLSGVSFTLGANVENLTLTGTAAINGTGNTLSNVLTGNSAANVLDGGTGADTMAGGQGGDIYLVDNAGDVVTENLNEGVDTVQSTITYTVGANVENLTLTGTSAINGTGNSLDNILAGNSAANVLTGGAGNDTYIVGAGDSVVESSNAGTDTVQSGLTYTLGSNVENLTLTGTSAINGTGNSLDNILAGNSAANVLTGGAGNDTYIVGAGDSVVESSNAGTDTVQSAVTWTLGSNVENLTLTGTAVANGTGNSANNVMIGNSAANVLNAANGNDTLRGGAGNDTINGGSGNDTYLVGRGEGQDLIQDNGGSSDKVLYDAGINPLDLVISRQANDLRLAIHGSADYVTVQNWYTSSANRTETIQAGNGQTLLNTQVNQLVQAMAAFTTQTGLSWDQAIDQRPQDVQTVLAASWQ